MSKAWVNPSIGRELAYALCDYMRESGIFECIIRAFIHPGRPLSWPFCHLSNSHPFPNLKHARDARACPMVYSPQPSTPLAHLVE